MKRSDTVYMAVTTDKYELPIAFFINRWEMAKWSGKSREYLSSAICKEYIDRINKCKYVRVFIGDSDLCQ